MLPSPLTHAPEGSHDAELRLVEPDFVARIVRHDPVVA